MFLLLTKTLMRAIIKVRLEKGGEVYYDNKKTLEKVGGKNHFRVFFGCFRTSLGGII